MPHFKSSTFTATLLASLISASASVNANHNNTLTSYKSPNEINQGLNSNKPHCEESSGIAEPETLCKQESNGKPAFDTGPILSISNQIDIRPENCLSFFDDYLHTRRGLRIESALSTTDQFSRYEKTVATFPVLDFISNRQGHMVKSKDVSSVIYTSNSENQPLYDSIIEDAIEIQTRIFTALEKEGTISAKVHGTSTTLTSGDITDVSLHIIIQAGMASPHQINQIKLAAIELKSRWGYQLAIIEIP